MRSGDLFRDVPRETRSNKPPLTGDAFQIQKDTWGGRTVGDRTYYGSTDAFSHQQVEVLKELTSLEQEFYEYGVWVHEGQLERLGRE